MNDQTTHPAAADAFWCAADALTDAPDVPPDATSALERLGPSPFPKSGFPFLGFLATVYDHVATHVGGANAAADSSG
jgi:hypothetical protein